MSDIDFLLCVTTVIGFVIGITVGRLIYEPKRKPRAALMIDFETHSTRPDLVGKYTLGRRRDPFGIYSCSKCFWVYERWEKACPSCGKLNSVCARCGCYGHNASDCGE